MPPNVLIITRVDAVSPSATAARLRAVSKGLNSIGAKASILWLTNPQTEVNDALAVEKQQMFGFRSSSKMPGKYLAYLNRWSATLRMPSFLKKSHQATPIDAVYLYGLLLPERFAIFSFCDKHKIPIMDDITEYPYLGREKKLIRKLEYSLFMNHFLPRVSAALCITKGIEVFIAKYLGEKATNTIISNFGIIVEYDKFSQAPQQSGAAEKFGDYLAYAGTMYGTKDGMPELVRAFSLSLKTHPQLKLVIIGDNTKKDRMRDLLAAVKECNCADSIHFTGRISWELMHEYLCGAQALVLAKPDNEQNDGCFPTKLGEYLSCGRPVITTSVGDIPLFLQDGVNSYLAEPGNVTDFAAKINECLENPQQSAVIAENGKALANDVFNYTSRAQELVELISLIKKRERKQG
ncbi:MAG: glycosyltransferase family 4 protein [Candidatus Cloacimonetes bacterium]|nr:glycosyltransferase family 4 protein [Candidatus Cloacimonadota bacterium]